MKTKQIAIACVLVVGLTVCYAVMSRHARAEQVARWQSRFDELEKKRQTSILFKDAGQKRPEWDLTVQEIAEFNELASRLAKEKIGKD